MQVTIRLVGLELPSERKNQVIELEDSDTVETALEKTAHLFESEVSLERIKKCALLKNNKRTFLDDKLNDGDVIQILRTLEGG